MKLKNIILTGAVSLTAISSAQAATTFVTLNTSNVTAAGDATIGVTIAGSDLSVHDFAGFDPTTGSQTITAPSTDIFNYQVNFVNSPAGATGTANAVEMEFGNFARLALRSTTGTVTFGSIVAENGGLKALDGTTTITGESVADNTEYGISIFMNNTGGALDYTDALGGPQSLANGTYDVWFGATSGSLALVNDGYAKLSAVATLTTVDYTAGIGGGVTNDTLFSPVPEPSSTALLGLGGLALILRRRK